MPQYILEPDQQGKFQATPLGFLDHIRQVNGRARSQQWFGDDVARVVDVVISGSPPMDMV